MTPRRPTFRESLELWVLIAAQSFGGPAGQIAVMHRFLVEERKWLGEERFLAALNYCMLLPGPEATQLVTWTGWVANGYAGGLAAGWMFVLPGFLAIFGLSNLYVRFHEVPAVAAALVAVQAAVLAIVVEAMVRIGRRVVNQPATALVAVGAFVALFGFGVPFPLVILAAGAVGAALPRLFQRPPPPVAHASEAPPLLDALLDAGALPHVEPRPARDLGVAAVILVAWLAPTGILWAALGPDATFTQIGTFFSTSAVVTFGGAYSVLAYVQQQAVEVHHWLTSTEMVDALGLAETTPGPLIQVVQFVGFLATYRDPGPLSPMVAGFLGSVLTSWATFAPSFLFVLAGGPYVERIRKVEGLSSALRAITAAVVGVIANLAVGLAVRFWFGDVTHVGHLVVPVLATVRPFPVVVALVAGVALIRYKAPMTPVLAAAAGVGVVGWAVARWL